MKKIFKIFTVIFFAFMFCLNSASAADTQTLQERLGLNSKDATAPEVVPEETGNIKAYLDTKFDFSKIKFSAKNNGEDIVGKKIMRKIIIAPNYNYDGSSDVDTLLGANWFTVYCLDATLRYPEHSLINYNFSFDLTEEDNEQITRKLQDLILFRLINDRDFKGLFSNVANYPHYSEIELVDTDINNIKAAINGIAAGNETTVAIRKIVFATSFDPETIELFEIDAKTLSGDQGATSFNVVFNAGGVSDLATYALDSYEAYSLDKNKYNHALWIIEHSYPTFSLNESLVMAGVSKVNLLAEIKALYADEENYAEITETEWEKALENHVYSTIQYAIWFATGGNTNDGKLLGTTLIGSNELNKLYNYLIRDRGEYTNYSSHEFNDVLSLIKPETEIFSQTNDYYVYGPYRIGSNLLRFDAINLSITSSNASSITIVNEALEPISSITDPEQNIYFKVMKNAKVADLKITLETVNAKTLYPSSNRGKIYAPYYLLNQNVGSGGKVVDANITKTLDLVFNPKTGVKDLAILFVIAIFAFGIGYLTLSLKNKPIKF